MDGENIPDEEIAPAVAVGASVIEHLFTVSGIAVVWFGWWHCKLLWLLPDDGLSRLIFQFQIGGARELDGPYIKDLRLIFVLCFRLFAQPITGHIQKKKIQKYLPRKSIIFCFSFLYFYGPIELIGKPKRWMTPRWWRYGVRHCHRGVCSRG